MEDARIIELYWQRNPQAIEETKTQHGIGLHKVAMGILRNLQDSEECVSDTYLKAWQTIPPTRPIYLFSYLSKICRNTALSMLDHMGAKKRSAHIQELTVELQNCISDSRQGDPADYVALSAAMNGFLSELRREERLLFLRRYWYGDEIKEIAKMFSIGQSAVKTRLFRLRQKLKAHLEKEGFDL